MTTKKLINSVDGCVDDALRGLVSVHSSLRILQGHKIVVREDVEEVIKAGKVTLLCGGGSGHEPAQAGYVGRGMLTAAVAGAVFASPPPSSILTALRYVTKHNSAGCVVVITNYTGDRLNFGLAIECAKREGLNVDSITIGEDCALTSSDRSAGRRGLAGTVLLNKICGALAEEGKSLEEIVEVGKHVTANMGTMGVSLTSCSVPGSGPTFSLGEDEMELGLGLHGEAGVKRTKIKPANEVVKMILDHMTNTSTTTHIKLKAGDKVACMVNNLGGMSLLEINIIVGEVIKQLEERGVVVERAYCGSFMTSLEMAGLSVTILHLDKTIKRCLDAKATVPGWSSPIISRDSSVRKTPLFIPIEEEENHVKTGNSVRTSKETADMLHDIIKLSMERLISSEEELNNLDKESGDGDCGTTLARGAKAIMKELGQKEKPNLPVDNPATLALSLARIVENSMGGSSGALYSLFFTSASHSLQNNVSMTGWKEALSNGTSTIMRYGGAQPGDRTMVDALFAADSALKTSGSLSSPVKILETIVQATESAALATASMKAQAGRASYVSAERLKNPDPGAVAVTVWFRAILEILKKT
ncbi:triokinase/FMN cyclase-like [Saccostrea echinata]|uniref:triokinase/FMN cyclase-like n=1 Tax=Saccostrea echinata TaxID=191078 RepID=UPI002A7F88F5|nr:triokinase/FMN cyclase-like [Saccostrea echinata]